ncbi:TetR/AcrR family transcriptional regulator [Mesorhizobium abyssinicae]|uniref:TetR/AcrR family transcriptional regulator n=1 Tax=Mesorhizobium abyssinicae TaxID=1209958 RepID=UPI003395E4D8
MPRIVDHQLRRQEICDVLLDVVAEHGLSGVTIRFVAEQGGWSTGVIAHYFKSRQDLLLGGLRRAADILGAHNLRALSTFSGLVALEQLLEIGIPLDARRLALGRIFVFFYVEAMADPDLRREIQSYLLDWRKSVAKAIKAAQTDGDISSGIDVKQAAMDLICLADGLTIQAILDPSVLQRVRNHSPVRYWIGRLIRSDQAVVS